MKLNKKDDRTKTPAANSTLAIGGVSSPLDSFVVAESSVLRTNFCAVKPAHRQSVKLCTLLSKIEGMRTKSYELTVFYYWDKRQKR